MHATGRAELTEEADRVAHVLRARRAVQPITSTRSASCRQHSRDVGAEQHLAAVGQQRDRSVDRQHPALRREGLACAEDRRLDLEDVLGGLDDQQVRAPSTRPDACSAKTSTSSWKRIWPREALRMPGDSRGADRARDEPVLTGCFAGQLGGLHVDLHRVVGQTPLLELDPRALEGIRLDDLAPASSIELCTPSMTSGRLSTSASWHLPASRRSPRSSARTARAWRHSTVVYEHALAYGLQIVTHEWSMLAAGEPGAARPPVSACRRAGSADRSARASCRRRCS